MSDATTSLWRATAPPYTRGSRASGELTADVAVVGAGVAGLSTALHLAEEGLEVLVLEAEQPGSGATGVSGGIIAPDFARDGMAKSIRTHGRERGERLARLVGTSGAFTFELIERYGIACDLQKRGFASPCSSVRELEAMDAEVSAWQALGVDVQLLGPKETADAIGTDVYRGALLFEDGGALNPLAYVNGLATAAQRTGVAIFTESPVRSLEEAAGGWRLQTPQARVSARRVVLAANAGNDGLHPALRNVTLPFPVYEYATPPLPETEHRRHFGAGMPFTDRNAYVFTARFDGDGRLISAIPDTFPQWNGTGFVREAERRMRDIYSMRSLSIDFVWHGTARLSPSLLPAVHLPEGDTSLIAIQACNGRGLGVNTAIGRDVAAFLRHGNGESVAVPLSRPEPVPLHGLTSRLPRMLMSLAQLGDRVRRPQHRS